MDIKAPTEFCKPPVTIVEDSACKGTSLAKWFYTKRVNSNGVMSYRILGKVTDNL